MSLKDKLLKVKSDMTSIKKGTDNKFFKSKYADLNSHLQMIEPLLSKNSLVLTQATSVHEGRNIVATTILDVESGDSISSTLQLPELSDMQKLGGAITYARRYTLSALLSMQAEDDDGNTASGKVSKKKVVRKATATDDF